MQLLTVRRPKRSPTIPILTVPLPYPSPAPCRKPPGWKSRKVQDTVALMIFSCLHVKDDWYSLCLAFTRQTPISNDGWEWQLSYLQEADDG